MIHMTLVVEDTLLIATVRKSNADEPMMVDVQVQDNHSGKSMSAVWTFVQFEMVVALALGMGEDSILDAETVSGFYEIVNPLFKDWPCEVIPVP